MCSLRNRLGEDACVLTITTALVVSSIVSTVAPVVTSVLAPILALFLEVCVRHVRDQDCACLFF